MQVPFIKYIESLVACKYSIDHIYKRLQDSNITLAAEFPREGIVQVYQVLSSTNPDYFRMDSRTAPDLEWLKEHEIEKLVAYELKLEIPAGVGGIRGAFEIINDANMYQTITALALAKITDEDIELIVNGKYNIHYEPDDLKEFIHYFFNVRDWSLSQKKMYCTLVRDPKLERVYKLAIEGDKDYLIWKLGIAPDRSFDQMLREMMSDSFYNFKEKMKADPESARKWGDLAIKITDRIEKIDKDSKDKKNLFDEIIFTLDGKAMTDTKTADATPPEKFVHFSQLQEDIE
jgi:hypothetical protein